MAKRSSWNPLAFVPNQVTIIASAVYIALFAVLIWVHTTVPSAPSNPTPIKGVNLTDAWLDLDFVSNGFHPIDSRRNEVVRDYLVQRITDILEKNGAEYKVVKSSVDKQEQSSKKKKEQGPKAVTLFEDNLSNVTFQTTFPGIQPWTAYQESTNVFVYVRGKDDEAGDWWESGEKYDGQAGVLVNAHYDSVSSGYGATDDGVGVVSILQLISYFTTEGNQPKRGAVFLLNNGEENGLYGAHNFLRHPISQFTHTFLNLEGAGAGGRATLFRSTDAEVTQFYSSTRSPFGTVISGDGFKLGFVRSSTDYSVFNGDNGMRGLDVAFFEPRARYHTDQDDARDTSPDSLWHMLSTSISTMKAMTSYEGVEFEGSTDSKGKLDIGTGSNGVWFDMFGRAFAVMQLPTLFALSVTLLVAAPVILIALQVVITRADKWYPLSKRQYVHSSDDDEAVHFSGMRGLFRFPIAVVLATAAVLALAYLLAKINPYIAYNSEYAVWAMMLSAWFAVAWLFETGADRIRPTALQRMYNLIWLYALSWALLVAATVGENNYQLASGYFVVIYNASVFVALLISYLELLALPSKTAYVEQVANIDEEVDRRSTQPSSSRTRASRRADDEDDDANESTSLLRSGERRGGDTFATRGKKRHPDNDGTLDDVEDATLTRAYGDEQAWSSSLPQWTWILQFIVLVPVNVIILGQIALLMTSAIHQTPADGNAPLPIYLLIAVLTTLLLLPLTPFLHRFVYQIPTFLFLIFIGCLIYNLLAFPFSRDARLKVYFVQTVDLNTGANNVTLTGIDGYLQDIIAEIPSAAGQALHCSGQNPEDPRRSGLRSCSWTGPAPHVVPASASPAPYSNRTGYKSWIDYKITHTNNSALLTFHGLNTKACRLHFNHSVSSVHIHDAAPPVGSDGSSQVRLFSRDWDKEFSVNVTWAEEKAKGQKGKVVCLWSDANQKGVIPAWDEVRAFAPVWAVGTKASDGLVEGFREFEI